MQIILTNLDNITKLTQIVFGVKRHWGYLEKRIESWRDWLAILPEFMVRNDTYAAIKPKCTVGF